MCDESVEELGTSCSPEEPSTPRLAAGESHWCTCPSTPAVREGEEWGRRVMK